MMIQRPLHFWLTAVRLNSFRRSSATVSRVVPSGGDNGFDRFEADAVEPMAEIVTRYAAMARSGSYVFRSHGAVVLPSAPRPSSIVISRSPLNAGLSSRARY